MAGTCPTCNLSSETLDKIKAAFDHARETKTAVKTDKLCLALGLSLPDIGLGINHVLFQHVPQRVA